MMIPSADVVRYPEHPLGSIEVDGTRYWIVKRSFNGLRVWWFTPDSRALYCEWPVVVRFSDSPTQLRWAEYSEKGLRSSLNPNGTLPHLLGEEVKKYLKEFQNANAV